MNLIIHGGLSRLFNSESRLFNTSMKNKIHAGWKSRG